jgi:hypothetical protein
MIEMGLERGFEKGSELMPGLNSEDLERRVDLVPRRLDLPLGVDRLEAGKQDPPRKGDNVRCTVFLSNLVASILYRLMGK